MSDIAVSRVLELDPDNIEDLDGAGTPSEAWDRAVAHGCAEYKKHNHCIW